MAIGKRSRFSRITSFKTSSDDVGLETRDLVRGSNVQAWSLNRDGGRSGPWLESQRGRDVIMVENRIECSSDVSGDMKKEYSL